MVKSDSEFRTTDTPLASFLIQEGFDLLIIEYEDRRNGKPRATFVFQDTAKLRENTSLYNRGDATINIARYEHVKSTLLDRIMRGLP